MRQYIIKTVLCLMLLCFLTCTVHAQYDGSFNNIYFDRSVSAQNSALGRSSKALPDNAFSIHSNSSLLGFQNGYLFAYSKSTPFYTLENATFNYYAVGGRIINEFFIGIGHLDYNNGQDWKEQLTTLAFIYRLKNNLSLSTNIKRFVFEQGDFTDEQGLPAGEGETSKRYYFDFTSSYLLPFKTPVADKTSLLLGFTFENIFRQEVHIGDIRVELPSIISVGANNKYVWNDVSNFFLIENISLSLIAEYQEVIDYEYKTRFSLGVQVGLNEYIKLRAGYFRQNENNYNISSNKSYISDFTYGAGATIPVSKFFSLNRLIMLSLDFTRLQQPLYTTDNPFNIGKFSIFSASVKINI